MSLTSPRVPMENKHIANWRWYQQKFKGKRDEMDFSYLTHLRSSNLQGSFRKNTCDFEALVCTMVSATNKACGCHLVCFMSSNFNRLYLTQQNLCCISKSSMKHLQKNQIGNWTCPYLSMVIGSACLLISYLDT